MPHETTATTDIYPWWPNYYPPQYPSYPTPMTIPHYGLSVVDHMAISDLIKAINRLADILEKKNA